MSGRDAWLLAACFAAALPLLWVGWWYLVGLFVGVLLHAIDEAE